MKLKWRWLVIAGVLMCGVSAFWFWLTEPLRAQHRWYRRVRADLMTLVERWPSGITKGQWNYAVGWTINLHAICGTADPEW
jgi:hypothetical protein